MIKIRVDILIHGDEMNRKYIFLACAVIFGFSAGSFFSSYSGLRKEFISVQSDLILRNFSERVALYLLVKSGQIEKLEELVITLLIGDLIALETINFSETQNAELYCNQLTKISSIAEMSNQLDLMSSNLESFCKR